VVQYLDRATGKIGVAGPGSTVFLSASGRYVLMAQDATTLGEVPAAGGALRRLTLPPGWYLPGGGNPVPGFPDLATANGVIVVARPGGVWMQQRFGVWNPGSHTARVLGRAYSVIGACTPPACDALVITNTATGATRPVFSPLPGGFAQGGAFSPDGTQLAVFTQTLPHGTTPGQARLALVGAPDDATATYLHDCFEPTARAIDGLEKALAGLGLLDDALALDLRKPQDYFHRVWSTAFRASDLAAAADGTAEDYSQHDTGEDEHGQDAQADA
jgi:hypothetical protein